MKQKTVTIWIERVPTREELRRIRRWRRLENVVNVVLGLVIVAGLFYAGWLVGSGAIAIGG